MSRPPGGRLRPDSRQPPRNRPAPTGCRSTERGSATIWLLGFVALVLAISSVAVIQALAVLARHRADAVADLAALAGAQRIGLGTDPCAAARRVAGENSATLTACSTSLDPAGRSGTIAVRLRREMSLPLAGHRWVTARAKAGRLAGTATGRKGTQPVAQIPNGVLSGCQRARYTSLR